MHSSKNRGCFKGVSFKLYCYWSLSSWNDQLWMFAAGMAFGSLGGNLQLTASAAFVASAAILLIGPTVGRWIDQSNRLRTALLTLLCTKVSIIITTALLAAMLHFETSISGIGGAFATILSVVCIIANMVSILGSTACLIIIQKDWVVVICHPDEVRLTATNTILLQIKLIFAFISPYMIGELMVWTTIGTGCFATALFTLVAFSIEGPLLYSVYHSVPDLRRKHVPVEQPLLVGAANTEDQPNVFAADTTANNAGGIQPIKDLELRTDIVNGNSKGTRDQECYSTISRIFGKFINSWRVYSHQKVLLAGISLSLLYMTVLGFDSITDVYAFSQGLKANTVALVKGCGALSGFVGSFAYPRITKRLGLLKTGMVALWLQVTCLILPLISVWLPGSPFDPAILLKDGVLDARLNSTEAFSNITSMATSSDRDKCATDKASIIVFLTGIVLSRIGLWLADLAVNQLFQETVSEGERGSVGSVQNALNYSMDMIKNAMVICLPSPKTFGFLIIGSWLSVFTACICYMIFAKRHTSKEVTTDGNEVWTGRPENARVELENLDQGRAEETDGEFSSAR